MDVKICFKCGAENKPDKMICSSCYGSIESVEVSQSRKSETPVVQKAIPQTPKKQAATPAADNRGVSTNTPNQMDKTVAMPTPPNGTPQGREYSPNRPPVIYNPTNFDTKPASQWPKIIGLTLTVLVVSVLIFAIVRAIPKKQPFPAYPPENTVSAYIEAKKTGNIENVKPYLSKDSMEYLKKMFGSRQAQSAGFGQNDAAQMLVFDADPSVKSLDQAQLSYKNITTEEEKAEDQAVIEVTVTSQIAVLGAISNTCELVVVPEDGQWKIDLHECSRRSNAGGIGKLLQMQK